MYRTKKTSNIDRKIGGQINIWYIDIDIITKLILFLFGNVDVKTWLMPRCSAV